MSTVREFYFSDNDLKLQIPCIKGSNTLQLTQFDKEFQASWKSHMDKGHFRYEIEQPESKVLKGDHGFIAQLQTNRASNRRPPQAMLHLEQQFSHEKFNFCKINEETEVIFELRALHGDGSGGRNMLIINVSPFELASSLLVPRLDHCLPQVLTEDSIQLAIRTVLLSGVKNCKAAFNSLCAYASVNHQHWHIYYLQTYSLKLETLPVKQLVRDCYVIDPADYPAVGFVFQVENSSAKEISRVAQKVFKVTSHLTKADIGHNVFITRGTKFGTPPGPIKSYDALRIYVWAREKIIGSKDPGAFVMAACELAGQILCYDEKQFNAMDEAEVTKVQTQTCTATFELVKPQIMKLLASLD